jgi:hypothetical protein
MLNKKEFKKLVKQCIAEVITETSNESVCQQCNVHNLKEIAGEEPLYVEFVSQRKGENPFTWRGTKWEYVNAKYPDGKIDIGVYSFADDMVISYSTFQRWVGNAK